MNDLFEGLGAFVWPDGSKYIGNWEDGKRNGQGFYTFSDGRSYQGEWVDDLK